MKSMVCTEVHNFTVDLFLNLCNMETNNQVAEWFLGKKGRAQTRLPEKFSRSYLLWKQRAPKRLLRKYFVGFINILVYYTWCVEFTIFNFIYDSVSLIITSGFISCIWGLFFLSYKYIHLARTMSDNKVVRGRG